MSKKIITVKCKKTIHKLNSIDFKHIHYKIIK